MEVGDPATIATDEDVSFFVKTGGFGPFEHYPLVEDLHGVDAFRVSQFDDANFSEGASTNHLDQFEIIACQTKALDLAHARFHCKT